MIKLVSKSLDFIREHGVIRFKSGVYKSWLKATPTPIGNQRNFSYHLLNNLWERHLAVIFEHFEPNYNTAIGGKMKV
jgi:hypothetical protein